MMVTYHRISKIMYYVLVKYYVVQPPYGGLLSSSCGELQPSPASKQPFRPKGDFAGRTNGRTDNEFKGVR